MTTQYPFGSCTLRAGGSRRRAGWWGWVLLFLAASGAFAASSGSTNLYTPGGAARPANVGDFLSSTSATGGTGNGPGGTYGQVDLTSRSGAITRQVVSANMSANNTWDRNVLARWGNDSASSDYGLWTLSQRISNTTSGGTPVQNYANLYYTNDQAAANPPAANPQANVFRLYLPTDGGAKPAKAYVEQFIACTPASACGTNQAVNTSRDYRITVRLAELGVEIGWTTASEVGGSVEHARIYTLLGDPALSLKEGATPVTGGPGGGLGG